MRDFTRGGGGREAEAAGAAVATHVPLAYPPMNALSLSLSRGRRGRCSSCPSSLLEGIDSNVSEIFKDTVLISISLHPISSR